ncbi:MAG: hypothetical protein L0206_24725 [Actinobacteria bacterium]|nr:hypothetical protein [Actinomycetota bacterium]
MTRTAVPRAAVFLLAIAILPWIATSPAGGWRSPTTSVSSSSDSIQSLTTPLVITPDRPKVWTGGERSDAARGLHAMPAAGTGIEPPQSLAGEILHPASAGSTDVLANDLAERGPPLQPT